MRQILIRSAVMFLSVYIHIFFIGPLGIPWLMLPLLVMSVFAFLPRRGLIASGLTGGLTYDLLVPGTFGLATGAFLITAFVQYRLSLLSLTEEHPLMAFGQGSVGVLVFFVSLGIGRAMVALFSAGEIYKAVSYFPYTTLIAIAISHGALVVVIALARELIFKPRKALVLN